MAVRWDAVVKDDHFWSAPPDPVSNMPAADPNSTACAQVWLFGSLADTVGERPIALQFGGPFSVADVIAEIGRRYGPELLARMTTRDGAKARSCRVFVHGEPVLDITTPIRAGATPTRVEMILLGALEGG